MEVYRLEEWIVLAAFVTICWSLIFDIFALDQRKNKLIPNKEMPLL